MAFLDKTGLERLWVHIVSKLSGKADVDHSHTIEEIGAASTSHTHSNYLPVKNIGFQSSYVKFVVPLCCLDNATASASRYFMGDLHLRRNNAIGQLATTIHINCGKIYNSTSPYYTLTIDGAGNGDGTGKILPCTFTYNIV